VRPHGTVNRADCHLTSPFMYTMPYKTKLARLYDGVYGEVR
jgi:hypothetical protein